MPLARVRVRVQRILDFVRSAGLILAQCSVLGGLVKIHFYQDADREQLLGLYHGWVRALACVLLLEVLLFVRLLRQDAKQEPPAAWKTDAHVSTEEVVNAVAAARLVSAIRERREPAKSVTVHMPANKPTIDVDVFVMLGQVPVRSLSIGADVDANMTPAKLDALLESCASNSTLRCLDLSGCSTCAEALTQDTVRLCKHTAHAERLTFSQRVSALPARARRTPDAL